jgi:sugar phosphate isomerase/epimerase
MARVRMPIGVFTSAGGDLTAAINKVLEVGVNSVQFHAPGPDQRSRARAREIADQFSEAGIDISLVFCGFAGERYDTIPIVRETVGLVPAATRAERLQNTKSIADFASWLDAPGIGIHVGFVSEDWDSPEFAEVVNVIGEVADYCAERGLTVNLETGQETAGTLLHVLDTAKKPNLGVNFDPANMILYGSGEPLEALRKVGKYVKSCHCKDATWSSKPGVEWGVEVPLGQGDVNIEKFVTILNELGYTGPLTIEREISRERQTTDIKAGIKVLRDIRVRLGIR